MSFCFNFRQISTYLPGTDAELLGKLIDGASPACERPHHAGEAIGLTIRPLLAASRFALVIHRLRGPASTPLRC